MCAEGRPERGTVAPEVDSNVPAGPVHLDFCLSSVGPAPHDGREERGTHPNLLETSLVGESGVHSAILEP